MNSILCVVVVLIDKICGFVLICKIFVVIGDTEPRFALRALTAASSQN